MLTQGWQGKCNDLLNVYGKRVQGGTLSFLIFLNKELFSGHGVKGFQLSERFSR